MTSLRDQNEILRSYSACLWQEIRFKANSHARYPHSFGWPNATYKDTKMTSLRDQNKILRPYSAFLWQGTRIKANSHPHSFGWPNATYKDTNMKMKNFSDLNAALGVKYHQNL